MRVSFGRNEYRLLYFFLKGHIVVAHAFAKKTDAIPMREIDTAEARQLDHEFRVGRGEVVL